MAKIVSVVMVIVAMAVAVMGQTVVDTGGDDLLRHIGGDNPALVMFYRETNDIRLDRMRKALDEVSESLPAGTGLFVGGVDFLRHPNTMEAFRGHLKSVPALVFFNPHSSIPDEFHGEITAKDIRRWTMAKLADVGRVPPVRHTLEHRDNEHTRKMGGAGLEWWQVVVLICIAGVGIAGVSFVLTHGLDRKHINLD